jgi:hypothetical protein
MAGATGGPYDGGRGANAPDEEALLPDIPVGFVILAGYVSVFGPLCGWLAVARTRLVPLWILYGAVLGPIAIAILLAAPPGECRACGWRVRGWTDTCLSCGNDVTTGLPPETDEISAGVSAGRHIGPHPSPALATSGATSSGIGQAVGGPVAVGPGRTDHGRSLSAGTSVLAATRDARLGSELASTYSTSSISNARTEDGWDRRPEPDGAAEDGNEGADDRPFAVLGSGVFVGGNRPLQPGSRYLLARVGPELQVFGPLHLNPGNVATRMSTKDIEVTVVGDRLSIGGRNPLMDVGLAFVGVIVEPGIDLRSAFRAGRATSSRR